MKKIFIILIILFSFGIVYSEENSNNDSAESAEMIYAKGMNQYFSYKEVNKVQAYNDFCEAADKNYVPAIMRKGICVFFGNGVKKDLEKGIKIIDSVFTDLVKEADTDINAMYELGNAYMLGIGVKSNKYEGFRYILKGANKGNLIAMETVAKCLSAGIGCEVNVPHSVEWLNKAEKLGSLDAKYNLGVFYINGIGVKKDKEKGLSMLEEACKKGNMDACLFLGVIYLKTDEKKAVEYFKVAAEGEHPRAMYYYGRCLLDGIGCEKNEPEGSVMIIKSAGLGDELAIDMLTDEKEKEAEEQKKIK